MTYSQGRAEIVAPDGDLVFSAPAGKVRIQAGTDAEIEAQGNLTQRAGQSVSVLATRIVQTASHVAQQAERIEVTAARLVEKTRDVYPKHVADIVHRALEIHPAARFQSIGEMRAALLTCLSGNTHIHESMLVTIPEAERIALPISAGTNSGTPAPYAMPVTTKRPNTAVMIAAVFVVALLGGLLSFFLFGKTEPERSTEKPEASISAPATNTALPTVSTTIASAPSASVQPTKKAVVTPWGTATRKNPGAGDIYLGR